MLRFNSLALGLSWAGALWVMPNDARAGACVSVETEKDGLGEADRAAAKTLLEEALRENGVSLGEPCGETYSVYHVRLGKSVNAVLTGPQGSRKGRASAVEELPDVYSQMVRSLIRGTDMDTAGNALTRDNVTNRQAAPKRVAADSLWYVRVGPGSILGNDPLKLAVDVGGGYRYELDRLGIDASANLMVTQDESNSNEGGVSGSWLRLMGLYFMDSTSNSSLYAGAGLSWGGAAVFDDNTYAGSGLQGEVAVGFELLRASSIRMFMQAGATLPFYNSNREDLLSGTSGPEKKYTPSFSLTFGAGWGKPRDYTVRVVE